MPRPKIEGAPTEEGSPVQGLQALHGYPGIDMRFGSPWIYYELFNILWIFKKNVQQNQKILKVSLLRKR